MPLDDAKLLAAAIQVLEGPEASLRACANVSAITRFILKVRSKNNSEARRLLEALVVARWGLLLDELIRQDAGAK